MFPVLIFMFVVATLAWLSLKINYFFSNTSKSIVSIFEAARLPSGKTTVRQIRSQNIIPFFCAPERMVVWVQDPDLSENCPSCGSLLFNIYQGGKVPSTALDR